MTEKKKRNTTELGPGSACDRILELRRDLQQALLDAQAEVIDRFAEREQAILARVPDDMKARALAMIAAAEEGTPRWMAELEVSRAALKVLPNEPDKHDCAEHDGDGDEAEERSADYHDVPDDPPDLVSVPVCLAEEYTGQHRPKTAERLTGKGRAK